MPSEQAVIHLYSQAVWHDDAVIVANRAGLLALQQAIEAALSEPRQTGQAEVYASDGEGYELHIKLLEDGQTWRDLRRPYSDPVAADRDGLDIWDIL